MPTYRGLLCDLDGTLADTEPLHCSAWLTTLAEKFGLNYDEHWFEQYLGTSDTVLAEDIVKEHKLEVAPEELIQLKREWFYATVRREGKAFAGIDAPLRKISDAYPLAIATNSSTSDTDVVVPALGLDRYTDIVVTASDVPNLKPAPDIYLLAAKRLGLSADTCIAIEDSAPGGRAAKEAGCYLIGLNPSVDVADETITENATALQRAYAILSGEG